MFRAISARSTPSTLNWLSIARRSRFTSSSFSSCTRRSGETPVCSRIFCAVALSPPPTSATVEEAEDIAATAERHDVTVLHYDDDYDRIAAVTGQPAEWVVPRGSVP